MHSRGAVSDNSQIFGFFLLKLVCRAKNSICFVSLGLQIAPRVKIIHFTPSVHNILFNIRMFEISVGSFFFVFWC
jgi:hypothetical protein